MDRNLVETKARLSLSEVAHLGSAAMTIGANESLFQIGLTSLSAVEIALVLENDFDTTFDGDDLFLDHFDSIASIVDFVFAAAS